MDYTEFKTKLMELVINRFGKENVELHEVIKLGDVVHDALMIGLDGEEVHPTVYIDKLYDSFQKGESFDSLIAEISLIASEEQTILEGKEVFSKFQEYETIKPYLVFKAINFKRNIRYLKDAVFVKRLDLALVFQVTYMKEGKVYWSVTVRKNILAIWKVTEEEIYKQAMENCVESGYTFRTMHSLLSEMLPGTEEIQLQFERFDGSDLYVLTNQNAVNGAGVIFYPGVLKRCAEEIAGGSDIAILPSSVHEVLLLDAGAFDTSSLREMVKSVNKSEVANDEILSNNVYLYESVNDRLLIV